VGPLGGPGLWSTIQETEVRLCVGDVYVLPCNAALKRKDQMVGDCLVDLCQRRVHPGVLHHSLPLEIRGAMYRTSLRPFKSKRCFMDRYLLPLFDFVGPLHSSVIGHTAITFSAIANAIRMLLLFYFILFYFLCLRAVAKPDNLYCKSC
jgi:hypothetical protein